MRKTKPNRTSLKSSGVKVFTAKTKASAAKQIRRLPKKIRNDLVEVVKQLQGNPRRKTIELQISIVASQSAALSTLIPSGFV